MLFRSQEIEDILDGEMKIIFFDQNYIEDGYDGVSFDFYKGGQLAIEYLIEQGHKKIAFLVGEIERRSRRLIYSAYEETMQDHGMDLKKTWVIDAPIQINDNHFEPEYLTGRQLTKLLLAQEELPTAIFVINDMTALGCLHELRERGLRIPEDMSIVGFDNISVADIITPGLTTINQPAYETGELATNMLLKRITGKDVSDNQIILEPSLIIRDSVLNIK